MILIAVKSLVPLPTVLVLIRQGMDGGGSDDRRSIAWDLAALTVGTGLIALIYSLILIVVRGSALDLPVYAVILNVLMAVSAFMSVAFFGVRTKLRPDNLLPKASQYYG